MLQGTVDLDQRGVHVGAFYKFQLHHAVVFCGCRIDILNTAEGAQCAFHGAYHVMLHLLGAGAGIRGNHHKVGEAHVGQKIGGHSYDRNHT